MQHIRKVKIKCHQTSLFTTTSLKNQFVIGAFKLFLSNCFDVMSSLNEQMGCSYAKILV